MSINLKNKMLNHTEIPPVGVWESIAFELDIEERLAPQTVLAQKIINYEEASPVSIWSNIAATLDTEETVATNNIVAQKLMNYEQAPPINIWDNIAAKLTEEEKVETPTLATRLLDYGVTPPTFIWSKISTEINKEEIKVIQIGSQRKIGTYIKFAAAASVAAIIGSAIWFSANGPSTIDTPLANNTNSTIIKKENAPSVTSTNTDKLLTTDTQEKDIASKRTVDKTKKNAVNKTKEIAPIDFVTTEQTSPLTKNPFDNNAEQIRNSAGDASTNIDLIATPNTYMTIVGPDGQSVKISSKFSKQAGYFTERSPDAMENIDFIIKESKTWRTKIAKWRDLLNGPNLSPSISNFMDVLEMSTILTDKKK
jgi:hypothetical protein